MLITDLTPRPTKTVNGVECTEFDGWDCWPVWLPTQCLGHPAAPWVNVTEYLCATCGALLYDVRHEAVGHYDAPAVWAMNHEQAIRRTRDAVPRHDHWQDGEPS